MKFDKAMLATTLAVSAAALAGCEQKQCVDAQGKVVSEANCKAANAPTVNGAGGTGGYYGGSHYSMVPFWVMWGLSNHGGGFMGRATSAPSTDAHSGAVSRGGFGGIGGGHGAGE